MGTPVISGLLAERAVRVLNDNGDHNIDVVSSNVPGSRFLTIKNAILAPTTWVAALEATNIIDA